MFARHYGGKLASSTGQAWAGRPSQNCKTLRETVASKVQRESPWVKYVPHPDSPTLRMISELINISFLVLCYYSLYVLIHFSQRGKRKISLF